MKKVKLTQEGVNWYKGFYAKQETLAPVSVTTEMVFNVSSDTVEKVLLVTEKFEHVGWFYKRMIIAI